MKNTTLTMLCCCVLLTACDKSGEPESTSAGDLTQPPAASGDAASTARDAIDQAAVEIESAVESAKESAVELAASAKQQTEAAVDAVKDSSTAAVTEAKETIAAVTSSDTGKGESVYKGSCFACHSTGAAGAPKLGDKSAWEARIAKGNAVLSQHALEGFKGTAGYMPPKGGYSHLSDQEVKLAVEYMVSQAQ